MALVEKDLVANVDTEWSVLCLRMAVVVAKVTSNKRKFIKMSMVNKTVIIKHLRRKICNYLIAIDGLNKCTGSYQEEGETAKPGTKCVGPCMYDFGKWGKSWCYTRSDRSQWGAECIDCQGTKGIARNEKKLH